MSWRVIEITTNGTYISKSRGGLIIENVKGEEHEVPISDIQSLILSSDGITITSGAVNALIENSVIILFVNDKYEPASLVYPTKGNVFLRKRLLQQIDLSLPNKKRLWQNVVYEKVSNQIENLNQCKRNASELKPLLNYIKSGDSTNIEAQAAKKYWNALFDNFSRSDESLGVNSMLNYGYAIIRSATARALAASGLNLSLGIYHHNLENDFCLVDDILEPYRPFVDNLVYKTEKPAELRFDLTPTIKKQLVTVLSTEVIFENKNTSLSNAILKTAQSFCDCIDQKTETIKFGSFLE